MSERGVCESVTAATAKTARMIRMRFAMVGDKKD